MKTLSTKILTSAQKELFPNKWEVIEKPLIEIEFGKGLVIDEEIQHAVFTSGNAVKAVFDYQTNSEQQIANSFSNVYCVGQKTKKLLENRGVQVSEVANNAYELAEVLAQKIESGNEVWFYCGNIRNSDLPEILAENGILVAEAIVYQTKLLKVNLDTDFDAVLFFSPSGVKSYVQNKEFKIQNSEVPTTIESHTELVEVRQPIAICIGSTTATEAVNAFEEVYIAEETSVESVIEKLKEII